MRIKFVDLEQGSQDWKDFRKGKLGSSSAASIMGVGFKTPLQLFEDMMDDRETPVNEAMIRGTTMEPIARRYLNTKYESDLQPVVVTHPIDFYDWHISSLDGLWQRPDGSVFVAEIKCPGRVDHQKALDGHVPEKYMPQLYHILEDLPDVHRILYFSYHPDSQAEVWVYRDKVKMDAQFQAELAFYNRILDCNPPEPMDKDWVDFRDSYLVDKANRLMYLNNEVLNMQAEVATIRSELIEGIQGCVRSRIGDLKVQKVTRKGTPQYSKIPELKGVNLDQYRGDPIISWRLSL